MLDPETLTKIRTLFEAKELEDWRILGFLRKADATGDFDELMLWLEREGISATNTDDI